MSTYRMDPVLMHIHQQWLESDNVIYDHLADEGIDTICQYKKLIDDPNKVNAIKNKTGLTEVDISDDLKEKLFCTLSYMNQLQMMHGPITKVGVYDFRLKSKGEFLQFFDAAIPMVVYDETKANLLQDQREQIRQVTDVRDFLSLKFYEAPSHCDGTDDISTPIASTCNHNQFPTAERSIFSTYTTNQSSSFTEARSNYDNTDYMLSPVASNIFAVPHLTAAKQTFEAQSKLFDRGISSVVPPADLMTAKRFFDEQSKLFDRDNPSADVISSGLVVVLVCAQAQCTPKCHIGQTQFWVRKYLEGYPDITSYPLLSTSCFLPTTFSTVVTCLRHLRTCVHNFEDNGGRYYDLSTRHDLGTLRGQPHCAFGIATTAMLEHKTVDGIEHKTVLWYTADANTDIVVLQFGECGHYTSSSVVVAFSTNVQSYFARDGDTDEGRLIVKTTNGGRLIGWNASDTNFDSNNVSELLEMDDSAGRKDGGQIRGEMELGDNAIENVEYSDDISQEVNLDDLDVVCVPVFDQDVAYLPSQVDRHIEVTPTYQQRHHCWHDRGTNGGVADDEIIADEVTNDEYACEADPMVLLSSMEKTMMHQSNNGDRNTLRLDVATIRTDYYSAMPGLGSYSLELCHFGANVTLIELIGDHGRHVTNVNPTAVTVDMELMSCINMHYSNCVARNDGGEMMPRHNTDATYILSRLFERLGEDVTHGSQYDKTFGCDRILIIKLLSRWGAAFGIDTVPRMGLVGCNHFDYLSFMLKWMSPRGEEGALKFITSCDEKILLMEVLAKEELRKNIIGDVSVPRAAGAKFGPFVLGSTAELVGVIEDSQSGLKKQAGDLLGHQIPRSYQRDEGIDRDDGEIERQETKDMKYKNLMASTKGRSTLHNIALDGYEKDTHYKSKLDRLRNSFEYGNLWIKFPHGDGNVDGGELQYVSRSGLDDIRICMETLTAVEYGGQLQSVAERKLGRLRSKPIVIGGMKILKLLERGDDAHSLIDLRLNERSTTGGNFNRDVTTASLKGICEWHEYDSMQIDDSATRLLLWGTSGNPRSEALVREPGGRYLTNIITNRGGFNGDYNPYSLDVKTRHIADSGFVPGRMSGPSHQFTNFFDNDTLQIGENIALEKEMIAIHSVRTNLEKEMTQLIPQHNRAPYQCRSNTIGCNESDEAGSISYIGLGRGIDWPPQLIGVKGVHDCRKTSMIIDGYDNNQSGNSKMTAGHTTTTEFGVRDIMVLPCHIREIATDTSEGMRLTFVRRNFHHGCYKRIHLVNGKQWIIGLAQVRTSNHRGMTNGNLDMDSCTYWYDIYVCIFGGRYDAYEGQRSSRHFHGGFRQQNDVRERILETRLQHW